MGRIGVSVGGSGLVLKATLSLQLPMPSLPKWLPQWSGPGGFKKEIPYTIPSTGKFGKLLWGMCFGGDQSPGGKGCHENRRRCCEYNTKYGTIPGTTWGSIPESEKAWYSA